jgi:hypothetical protein
MTLIMQKTYWKPKITRSNAVQLNATIPSLSQTDEMHTCKQKRPQNQQRCDLGMNSAKPLGALSTTSSKLKVTSWKPSPTSMQPHPPMTTKLLYWNSTEAAKLFLPTTDEENCLVAIENQISVLHDAISAPIGYLTVVDCIGEAVDDPSELLTEYQVWVLWQKCQLLFCVLSIAKKKMPTIHNWDAVCAEGLEVAKSVGVSITRASRVVRNDYQGFRKRRNFQVKVVPKNNLTPFLEQNKDVCMANNNTPGSICWSCLLSLFAST